MDEKKTNDVVDALERLQRLKDSGLLSDEELAQQKAEILANQKAASGRAPDPADGLSVRPETLRKISEAQRSGGGRGALWAILAVGVLGVGGYFGAQALNIEIPGLPTAWNSQPKADHEQCSSLLTSQVYNSYLEDPENCGFYRGVGKALQEKYNSSGCQKLISQAEVDSTTSSVISQIAHKFHNLGQETFCGVENPDYLALAESVENEGSDGSSAPIPSELDLDVSMSQETNPGNLSETFTILEIQSKMDSVTVESVTVNRGNCKALNWKDLASSGDISSYGQILQLQGLMSLGVRDIKTPPNLGFGETAKLVYSRCDILEVEILTDRGGATYTFK